MTEPRGLTGIVGPWVQARSDYRFRRGVTRCAFDTTGKRCDTPAKLAGMREEQRSAATHRAGVVPRMRRSKPGWSRATRDGAPGADIADLQRPRPHRATGEVMPRAAVTAGFPFIYELAGR